MDVRVILNSGEEFFVRKCSGFGPDKDGHWVKFWSYPRGKDKMKTAIALVRVSDMKAAFEAEFMEKEFLVHAKQVLAELNEPGRDY